jgi:hypothetical protein
MMSAMDPIRRRATFSDADAGLQAAHRLRAAGFVLDVSSSVDGDVVVIVEVPDDRLDELHGLVRDAGGRLGA